LNLKEPGERKGAAKNGEKKGKCSQGTNASQPDENIVKLAMEEWNNGQSGKT